MLIMILKMTAVTAVMVGLTIALWLFGKDKEMTPARRVIIGLIFGAAAIISTHFGVDYQSMVLNVRDAAPLAAGLFFDPISGIIAGLIGGIERYIAGTYWGVGSFTRIACSVSTCLAGVFAAVLNKLLFKGKKPQPFYAFCIGAVMEVFHMYVVFITHRNDMNMASYVVETCSIPMIIFTGLGMGVAATILRAMSGTRRRLFHKINPEELPISTRFQLWLLVFTAAMFLATFFFSYSMQTRSAIQAAQNTMEIAAQDVKSSYNYMMKNSVDMKAFDAVIGTRHVGSNGELYLTDKDGVVAAGYQKGLSLGRMMTINKKTDKNPFFFDTEMYREKYYGRFESLDNGYNLIMVIPYAEVFRDRKSSAYETAFADILLFALVFMLIYVLVQHIIVNNLDKINESLAKITRGDLDEKVDVRSSTEFVSLSDDINLTVSALKGYISDAEKRIDEELEFARAIQAAALPTGFKYPGRDEYELFALMDPAKEVGGDFYDFFFVRKHKLALVIADVSGKGIPAALFMMRSKTAIKSLAERNIGPAEILEKANEMLCEGNDACMFVTVWMAIVDLETGIARCANAGHEYPAIKRANGAFELYKDKHDIMLGMMEGMKFKEYELQLGVGDKLFVYTDGIPEAINEEEVQYGTDRMIQALNESDDQSFEKALPYVRKSIADFAGKAAQFDDITMLAFELKKKAEE